jgi:hypothetical protein
MRLLRTKSETDRLLDTVGESLAALSGGVNRNKLKVGLIAGGAAALTAGSAAISSIRRRTERKNS